MDTQRRDTNVIITGCGWVLADRAGSTAQFAEAAAAFELAGDRAASRVNDALPDSYPSLAAEVRRDRGAWMTAIAIEHALADAELSREKIVPDRTGMVIGSALAGQLGMLDFAGEVREQSPRFVSPINFPKTVGNFVGGAIARAYDFKGPNLTIASGAATGLDAVIEGCTLIVARNADVVLAGVTEVRSEAFSAAFADEPGAAGEGACWFVIERADHPRGAARGCAIQSWRQFASSGESHGTAWGSLSGPFALLAWIARQAQHVLPPAFDELIRQAKETRDSKSGPVPSACATFTAGSSRQHVTSLTVRAERA